MKKQIGTLTLTRYGDGSLGMEDAATGEMFTLQADEAQAAMDLMTTPKLDWRETKDFWMKEYRKVHSYMLANQKELVDTLAHVAELHELIDTFVDEYEWMLDSIKNGELTYASRILNMLVIGAMENGDTGHAMAMLSVSQNLRLAALRIAAGTPGDDDADDDDADDDVPEPPAPQNGMAKEFAVFSELPKARLAI